MSRTRHILLLTLGVMLLVAGCTSSGPVAPAGGEPGGLATTAASARDFATGPAVLIPAGYQPPTDRVDSTGAYLPVNDQPTLVFLEAIW